MALYLDFEQPIAALEAELNRLQVRAQAEGLDVRAEVRDLEKKIRHHSQRIYRELKPWQRIQIARHPDRPYAMDYVSRLFPGFMELSGDRNFGEDPALLGGVATWPQTREPFLILMQQKGRGTKERIRRNFGMPNPEGYRKAERLMRLAQRFKLPILSLVDTPGAFPGLEAEARGQSEAIAQCLACSFELDVPMLTVILGEGGSGGALAIALGNAVWMLQNSWYSVISPESCASILWSDATRASEAAEKLKLFPEDLLKMQVVDGVVPEPLGGAHRDPEKAILLLGQMLKKEFYPCFAGDPERWDYRAHRKEKYRQMGRDALLKADQSKLRSRNSKTPEQERHA